MSRQQYELLSIESNKTMIWFSVLPMFRW